MRTRAQPGRARTGTLGVLVGLSGSLLVHALLFNWLLVGTGHAHVRKPVEVGLGADAIVANESFRSLLILIDASDPASTRDEPRQSPSSQGTVRQSAGLRVISYEPIAEPAFDIEADIADDADSVESSGDPGIRARQFGIYLRQIQARVDRAWIKSRAPIDSEVFDCTVTISQSRRGEVREVAMDRCHPSVAWQLSLVRAIERASPLPAPPDAAVFSDSIQMSFQARPFSQDARPDEFETEFQ
jgi:hypothetical protein